MTETYYFLYHSPVGQLKIFVKKQKIVSIKFLSRLWQHKKSKISPNRFIVKCRKQLDEYFSGRRQKFSLPVKSTGTTFQTKVWQQLLMVPYGQTVYYREVARQINIPKSYRAVANALGKNPLPVIVPCHRVIKSDGTIGGFSGGKKRKEILLYLEKKFAEITRKK